MQHSAVSVGFYFCQTPPLGKLEPALSGSVTIPSRWQKRDQYVIVESVGTIGTIPFLEHNFNAITKRMQCSALLNDYNQSIKGKTLKNKPKIFVYRSSGLVQVIVYD